MKTPQTVSTIFVAAGIYFVFLAAIGLLLPPPLPTLILLTSTRILLGTVGAALIILGIYIEMRKLSQKPTIIITLLSMSVMAFLTVGVLMPRFAAVGTIATENARLTTQAWDAYNTRDYKRAIDTAEECIDTFGVVAHKDQTTLVMTNFPMPPVGAASKTISRKQREKILGRGVLNDVAACWFIKGRSLEKLEWYQEAIQAYRETTKYTYARVWDPSWKGFWAPAEEVRNRLVVLERRMKQTDVK